MRQFHPGAVLQTAVLLFMAFSANAAAMPDSTQSDGLSLFNRAVQCFNSTDYRTALKIFANVDTEGNNSFVRYYLGACSYQIGDYKGAMKYLSAVAVEDSLYPFASFYQAETMIALHNPGAALEFLSRSLCRDSAYAPARLEYIRTLCAVDSFQAAEQFVGRQCREDEALTLSKELVGAKKFDDAYPFLVLVVTRDST
ncbi:MAG TPA: hypothetical protein PL001_09485, partial [Candidatus Kryptobacter bacterium]|nr:hypothetical protein [Candidatus Kryptobacter bacterium]